MKQKILQILKANYVYTRIAEKIADEIMELLPPKDYSKHTEGCDIQRDMPCSCGAEDKERQKLLEEIPY